MGNQRSVLMNERDIIFYEINKYAVNFRLVASVVTSCVYKW
jgi:hypothetical protein